MAKSIVTGTLPVELYLDRVSTMFNFATAKVLLNEPLCNDNGDVVIPSGLYVLGLTRLSVCLSPIVETDGKAAALPDDAAYVIHTEELGEFVQSVEFHTLKGGLFIFGYDGVSMTLHVAGGIKTFNIIGQWKGLNPKHNPDTNTKQKGTDMNNSGNTPTDDMSFLKIHTLSSAPDTDFSVSGLIKVTQANNIFMLAYWHLWRFVLTKEMVFFQRIESLNPEVASPVPGLEFPNVDNKRGGLLDRSAFLTTPGSRTEWLIADFYKLVGSELHFYKGAQRTYVLDINRVSTWAVMPAIINQKENTMSSDNTNPTDNDQAPQWAQAQAQQGHWPTPMTGFGHQPPSLGNRHFQPGMMASNPYPTGVVGGFHPAGLSVPPHFNGFPGGGMPPGGSPFPNQPYPLMPSPGQGSWAHQPPTPLSEIMLIFSGEFTARFGRGWVLGTPSLQGRVLVTIDVKPNGTFSLMFTPQGTPFSAGHSDKSDRLEHYIPVVFTDIKVCVVQLKDKVVSVFMAGRNSDLFEHVEVGKIFFSETEILHARIEELEKELESFKKLA